MEVEALVISFFHSGSRKRKPEEVDDDEKSQQLKKKRKLNQGEKDGKEFACGPPVMQAEVVFPQPEVMSTSVSSGKNLHKTLPKTCAKTVESKSLLKISNTVKGEVHRDGNRLIIKTGVGHSRGKSHSVQKKEAAGKVSKGKIALVKAIKAKRDGMKSSTVTSVCQKGGILRSVQLSKHPILMNDLKMERAQQTEAVFQQRYVCPYCTLTSESADAIRKHLDETHEKKDPTVIDRLCYVRKQRCKTFYCWNPDCAYQTAVCEEREFHMETSRCGKIYEQKFDEQVPKVKEKRTPLPRKSILKIVDQERIVVRTSSSKGTEEMRTGEAEPKVRKKKKPSKLTIGEQSTAEQNDSVMDESKREKIRKRILQLFNEQKSQSLEREDILESLVDCSEDELSHVLCGMAEDNVVVYSGSNVFLV